MMTVPHKMVELERRSDYGGVGLQRFHCTCVVHDIMCIQVLTREIFAFLMVISCCAITDNTSMSILLNSSKQHHAPD